MRAGAMSWMVVAAALLAVAPAVATPVSAAEPFSVVAVDGYIQSELTASGIPGASIAITHGTDVVHLRGFGRDSQGTAVTAETPFRIASLSKSFAALAMMQLVDAGRLSLDDPVEELLPEFHPDDLRARAITVRQLLDQTSGLADSEDHDLSRQQPDTLTEATAMLTRVHLAAEPGAEFNYSNPNYQVAGRLIEVLSSESYDEYMHRHVFVPAGMADSLTTDKDNEAVDGLADGHVIAYGRPIAAPGPGDFAGGSGGVVSTAADMARWLILQSNAGVAADGTRIVSAKSMQEMHRASAPNGYALGWDTAGPASARRIEHNGSVMTFSAFEAVLPRSGYGLAIMFNASSGLMLDQTRIYYGLLKMLKGEPAPAGSGLSAPGIDAVFGVATLLILALGARNVVTARRGTTRSATSRGRIALGFAFPAATIAFLATVPSLVGWGLDGRDLTWVTMAYGSPALVILAASALVAAGATLSLRLWSAAHRDGLSVIRDADRKLGRPRS